MNLKRRDFLKFILIGAGGLLLGRFLGSSLLKEAVASPDKPNPGHSVSEIEPSGTNGQSIITSSGVTTWGSARYS